MSWGVVYSYWVGVGGRGLKTVELGALQPPAWVLHNFLGHLSSRGRCKWKGSHEEWWLYIFSNQPGLKQRNKSDVKQTISKQKLKNDLTHLLEDPDFVHVEDHIHSSGFDGMQHPRRLSSECTFKRPLPWGLYQPCRCKYQMGTGSEVLEPQNRGKTESPKLINYN